MYKLNKNSVTRLAGCVSNLPVNVNGVSYVGGFESAIKLDASAEL